MWDGVVGILGLAAFLAILWVMDHGIDGAAAKIGEAVKAFRSSAGL